MFAWWWALWLIAIFVDGVSIQVVLRSDTTPTLVAGTAISLVGYLLRIPAGLLALRVVRLTTERQEARAVRLGASA